MVKCINANIFNNETFNKSLTIENKYKFITSVYYKIEEIK